MSRTRFDPNEIRTLGDYAEMDVYDRHGEVKHTTLIDREDIPRIQTYKWGSMERTDRKWGPYIVRHGRGGSRGAIYLHRFVMEPIPDSYWVDHLDGNTLDNRKSNLRLATPAENVWNQREMRGVNQREGIWWASISRQFDNADDAARQRLVWEEARI